MLIVFEAILISGGYPLWLMLLSIIIFILLLVGNYLITLNHFKKILARLTDIKNRLSNLGNTEDDNLENKITELQAIQKEIGEDLKFANDKILRDISNNIKNIIDEYYNQLIETKKYKVNRSEFLGNVAHELNTPIFAIQLSLETLIDGAVNDKNVNIDFLKRALKNTKRLAGLTKDLIDISKLETEKRLSKRYIRINELITEAVGFIGEIAQNKNIQMKFDFQIKDNVQILCDSEMIKQVIINLVENAAKYTPEGGEIIISTKANEKEVLITVKDNGSGIPEKDLPHIFERFYRVDKNRSRNMGGSGLGLAIVKHILELHNSRINVTSKEGQGTTFEFALNK